LIAFSSYNPMRNNVQRDTMMVGLTNYFTAIYACAVIFSIMGFKANLNFNNCKDNNADIIGRLCRGADRSGNLTSLCHGFTDPSSNITRDIYEEHFEDRIELFKNFTTKDDIIRVCDLEADLNEGVQGTGLAFIIFTQAINEFGPAAPFFSIMFFLMLLSLGIGSEFGTIEGVTTSLYDLELFPWMKKKWLVAGILCFTMCTFGLLFVLGSGSYWVNIFDTYAGSFGLILIALGECFSVGWVFGVNRFGTEIMYMIGHRPHWFWKICWKFLAPLTIVTLLIGIVVMKFSNPITYKAYNAATTLMDDLPYPWYAGILSIVLVTASISALPMVAILRKLGILKYDHAKVLAAETYRASNSTSKFMGSQASSRAEQPLTMTVPRIETTDTTALA